ncbi:retrovirus-related pol polyprotein from transposon TNT 1-94 [Tanacetum coccineum]
MQQINSSSVEEEIDHHQFIAGIASLSSHLDFLELLKDWIYDIGASDHMTPVEDSVFDPYQLKIKPRIKLLNGESFVISHVRKVKQNNGTLLKDVLVVPSFKFSLLSMQKLTEDSQLDNKEVDDCSRGTRVYLLKQKSNSFEELKSFIKFVSTQFRKQVKVVRPQQNKRFERKHSHILDTARALRFHSKFPLKFSRDCVTTTTYLVNILPSSIVGNMTPYEILLNKKPIYDHLRVFGCFAMVKNPSKTVDKFDPRGKDLVNFKEVVADSGWCTTMDAKLKALEENSLGS